MSARLLVGGEGCKAQYVQFVSVYAPTFAAKQAVKERFFTELQGVLDRTATNDILVIVGDFNARVGSRTGDIDRDVLGIFGVDERNEAGDCLLEFCMLNNLRVMNTIFNKRNNLKHT